MTRLYQKDELLFSLLAIAVYVVLFRCSDQLSASLGMEQVLTAPLGILFALILWLWVRRQGLSEKYGLRAFRGGLKPYLYFLPLLLLASCNLWNGVTGGNRSAVETALYVLSMICAAFLEELLFRGFLFQALCRENVTRAMVISSVTFGLGHIVNLLRGAALVPTLLQLCYACAIGFLFTVIVDKSKCLLPCVITHGAINALSAFAVEPEEGARVLTCGLLVIVSIAYACFLLRQNGLASAPER